MNNIDYDNKEMLESKEFKDWLNGLLQEQYPITVTFIKKDGTIRTMKCSKNLNNIPIDKVPAAKNAWDKFQTIAGLTKVELDKEIRVFDIEKQDWRSFNFSSIKKIEFTIE